MNHGVALGIVGNHLLLLVLLSLYGLFGFSLLVLVLLRQFVVFLLILSSPDGGKTSFLSLQFGHDGLQSLLCGSLRVVEHLLYQRVV